MENCETFWTVLDRAGPEEFVQTLKAHSTPRITRGMAHELLGAWLERSKWVKIPLPEKDERGNVLRLTEFHGSLSGTSFTHLSTARCWGQGQRAGRCSPISWVLARP